MKISTLVSVVVAHMIFCACLFFSSSASAVEQHYQNELLPVLTARNVFLSPHADFTTIQSELQFDFQAGPWISREIKDGIEVRIYSLQPTPKQIKDGSWTGLSPTNWNANKPDHCRVFLSLVYRFSPSQAAQMVQRNGMDLGRITDSSGWLQYVDQDVVDPGYYVLTLERSTDGDPPQFPDLGGWDGKYELIRLKESDTDKYFSQKGFYFTVQAPRITGGAGSERIDIIKPLREAAQKMLDKFHCYSVKNVPEAASIDRMRGASNAACATTIRVSASG